MKSPSSLSTIRAANRSYAIALSLAEKSQWKEAWHKLNDCVSKHEHGPSLYAIGNWYLHGRHVKKNVRNAVKFFARGVCVNHAESCYELAVCLELGQGIEKDIKRAAKLYETAAKLGDKDAFSEYARCLYWGIGRRKDHAMARIYYRRAASLGDPDACETLSMMYADGKGGVVNLRLSNKWSLRAVENRRKEQWDPGTTTYVGET